MLSIDRTGMATVLCAVKDWIGVRNNERIRPNYIHHCEHRMGNHRHSAVAANQKSKGNGIPKRRPDQSAAKSNRSVQKVGKRKGRVHRATGKSTGGKE